MNHDLIKIPKRELEIRNKESGIGTHLELELTDDDIKKLQKTFNSIGVEIKLLRTEAS